MQINGKENSTNCPFCGVSTKKVVIKSKDYNKQTDNYGFAYKKCCSCGSVYIVQVPPDLSKYYCGNYPPYDQIMNKRVEMRTLMFENYKVSLVRKYAMGNKLIELGPSTGGFLEAARAAGFDVMGLEQSEDCVKYMSGHKLNAIQTNVPAEVLGTVGEFDVVVAFHVLEHLPDVQKFASSAASVLKKRGGIVVLSVPNPAALSFRIFGGRWVHLDAPRHLSLLSMDALDQVMAKVGCSCLYRTTSDPVSNYLSRMGWVSSMMNLISQNSVVRLCGHVLALFMRPIEYLFGSGAAYTVVYSCCKDESSSSLVQKPPIKKPQ